jgi:hypothetical protein
LGEPFLHVLGARGYLGGGDTARGVVVMHHLWMLSTSLLYCSPKLFSRSVESEEARSFGVPYTEFFPAVEPPSAAGICNLFVAISSEICSSFASGTLEVAGGASPPSAPSAFYFPLDWGSAHGRRQPRAPEDKNRGRGVELLVVEKGLPGLNRRDRAGDY